MARTPSTHETDDGGIDIPTYRIDLSLPPAERYTQLATDFGPQMRALAPLFGQLVADVVSFPFLQRWVEFLAGVFLRRVYSVEETEELRGISKASGLEMYFLVGLNVLLDSLLGCTSGGAIVKGGKKDDSLGQVQSHGDRMMHFRTLDWGMDGLRDVIVVLEFVRSKSSEPERVVGRTVTYAGFVGVLTGVRENLSLSLNFRPNHNCTNFSLRLHQILVLFGFRPSISSLLRCIILPPQDSPPATLPALAESIPQTLTAPCYLVLCDSTNTVVIEKDLNKGTTRSAGDFIVHTNHDTNSPSSALGYEEPPLSSPPPTATTKSKKKEKLTTGMDELLEESAERRACIQNKWNALVRRQEQKKRHRMVEGRRRRAAAAAAADDDESVVVVAVREEVLKGWVRAYPIANECTHFRCILDPREGRIRWLTRGPVD